MKNKIGTALTKELCYVCGKEVDGPILINKILTVKKANDVKKFQGKVIGFTNEPCHSCQEDMKKAFIFIGFDEEKSDFENIPEGFYRTGHYVGVTKNSKIVTEFVQQNAPDAIEKGYLFCPHIVMAQLGLIQLEENE